MKIYWNVCLNHIDINYKYYPNIQILYIINNCFDCDIIHFKHLINLKNLIIINSIGNSQRYGVS